MLQMLVSNALSTCCTLRWGEEQSLLTWNQIDLNYTVEQGGYMGRTTVNINSLINKTCNLKIYNSYAREKLRHSATKTHVITFMIT